MVFDVSRTLVLTPIFVALLSAVAMAQSKPESSSPTSEASEDSPPGAKRDGEVESVEISPAVKSLQPFFERIQKARYTRVTVELSSDTVIDGAVIGSQQSTYQIASVAPDQFTVYLKDKSQRTRIYSNGKKATIALSPLAYTHLDGPIRSQDAVFNLPIAMGPYPEVIMALSLAGVDPNQTFIAGNKTVDLVDRQPFRGEIPSLHFEGVQDDDVQWDLWITQDADPKPLRLLVDLTEMLRANGSLEMPAGYKYLLRFDFKLWDASRQPNPSMFVYTPIKEATQFESVDAYLNQKAKEQPSSDANGSE